VQEERSSRARKVKGPLNTRSTYLDVLYDYCISAMIAPHYGATRLAWLVFCVRRTCALELSGAEALWA
jgi:hypothetical protein